MAFSTAMRTQEMAIRLALGSQRAALMRLVLGSAMKLGLAGSILGVAAALFTMRLLSSFLFEVQSLDPVILLLAAGFIFLLALAASAIPACRAASIEPVEALRAE
jgi:ABC-type antimicrobial peptide transport system permease subunit